LWNVIKGSSNEVEWNMRNIVKRGDPDVAVFTLFSP